MKKIKAAVVGATGYAGIELVRLLLRHPSVELAALTSVSFEGKPISDVYPHLAGICTDALSSGEDSFEGFDVVFASLPHGLSEPIGERCVKAGAVLIDLGADFRLADSDVYAQWYKREYSHPELHGGAVYCVPELHRERLAGAAIIGNPGCYPTAASLALAPALRLGLIKRDPLIIDAKSGVTGAGRSLTQNTHFPDCNEAFSAYKAGEHRHTPEIEQTLSELAGEALRVTFVPHLLPVNRGIEETIYARLASGVSMADVRAEYGKAYAGERFVRLMPAGEYANIRNVRCSNYCDISLHGDARTGTLIICSCIDNMFKGAAGQAIQNMNIRFGIDESAGIDAIPSAI